MPLPMPLLGSLHLVPLSFKHNHASHLKCCQLLLARQTTLPSWKHLSSTAILSVSWSEQKTKSKRGRLIINLSLCECRKWSKPPSVCYLSPAAFTASFSDSARPSVDGRLFLEQLIDALKTSEHDEDGRGHADLAADLGFSATALTSFSHSDPQRASLRAFNAAYPSNEDKEALINVTYLMAMRPRLLPDLLGEFHLFTHEDLFST